MCVSVTAVCRFVDSVVAIFAKNDVTQLDQMDGLVASDLSYDGCGEVSAGLAFVLFVALALCLCHAR